MFNFRKLYDDRRGAGFIAAVVLLIGVMMSCIIGAIVFFAFADGITPTSTDAQNVTDDIVTYAITVFALLAIIPLIMVGGLMLDNEVNSYYPLEGPSALWAVKCFSLPTSLKSKP
jgi:Na+-driven multidrug efflux pump